MAKVLNNTVRPYNLGVNYEDVNGIARQKAFHLIPGVKTEVEDKDLAELKKSKGFKRYVEAGYLEIVQDGAIDVEETKISKAAAEFAEDHDFDLTAVTPNDKNAITLPMVKEAYEASILD